jgi:hypothetical protein
MYRLSDTVFPGLMSCLFGCLYFLFENILTCYVKECEVNHQGYLKSPQDLISQTCLLPLKSCSDVPFALELGGARSTELFHFN